MITLKTTIISLVCIYVFSIAFFHLGGGYKYSKNKRELSTYSSQFYSPTQGKELYKFIDPSLAIKVLRQLDIYKPFDTKYDSPFLGLKSDDLYCERHRIYMAMHPSAIFQPNFLFEWNSKSLMRTKVTQPLGYDVMPKVSAAMPQNQRERYNIDIDPAVNTFVTTHSVYRYKKLGLQFSCLSQESNHIPGNNMLARKDYIAEATNKYVQRFKDRSYCMSHDKIFPKTWQLINEKECREFFKELNSPQYQRLKQERRIVFIRKLGVGVHRGEGVFPFNEEQERTLRKMYDNGKKCGQVNVKNIMQYYIHNPLLLNGRKFDFRMYMLVASTNPLIAYYHDGFLRVSLLPYDKNSDDKKVLLTNLILSQQIYDDVQNGNLFEGKTEEELKVAQQWSFDRLLEYLMNEGIVRDPKWLDNYLRPELKRAMIHLLRSVSHNYFVTSSVYELYGVDFMLDENLNLWFIEANDGPAFDGYSIPMERFIVKMLQDHFEIVHAILKSRMKRVINYVNNIIKSGQVEVRSEGEVVINDLEFKIMQFEEITRNYIDEEFEVSKSNGFSKIIDGNFVGTEMYQGYIAQQCL